MSLIKQLSFISAISLFFSCRLFQPTAYFFITNESTDKPSVDFKVSIGGKSVFDDTIRYNNLKPDLQYTPSKTLTKGKYTLFISSDNGKTNLTQPIILDSDCWIFITYSFNSPADSIQRISLKKYFGYDSLYLNTKLPGTASKIGIFIADKKPVHL